MKHLVQWLSAGTVDFDAMYHNLDSHQHCSLATGHEQNSASLEGRFDIHILIGSESESLAKTSKICHLSTVKQVQNQIHCMVMQYRELQLCQQAFLEKQMI